MRALFARRTLLTTAHNVSWRSSTSTPTRWSTRLQYAMNTQAVDGEKGKGNFKPVAGAAAPERLGLLFIR